MGHRTCFYMNPQQERQTMTTAFEAWINRYQAVCPFFKTMPASTQVVNSNQESLSGTKLHTSLKAATGKAERLFKFYHGKNIVAMLFLITGVIGMFVCTAAFMSVMKGSSTGRAIMRFVQENINVVLNANDAQTNAATIIILGGFGIATVGVILGFILKTGEQRIASAYRKAFFIPAMRDEMVFEAWEEKKAFNELATRQMLHLVQKCALANSPQATMGKVENLITGKYRNIPFCMAECNFTDAKLESRRSSRNRKPSTSYNGDFTSGSSQHYIGKLMILRMDRTVSRGIRIAQKDAFEGNLNDLIGLILHSHVPENSRLIHAKTFSAAPDEFFEGCTHLGALERDELRARYQVSLTQSQYDMPDADPIENILSDGLVNMLTHLARSTQYFCFDSLIITGNLMIIAIETRFVRKTDFTDTRRFDFMKSSTELKQRVSGGFNALLSPVVEYGSANELFYPGANT